MGDEGREEEKGRLRRASDGEQRVVNRDEREGVEKSDSGTR